MKTLRGFILISLVTVAMSLTSFAQTSLRSLDGGQVNVSSQNGKVVVLAIGATWLPLSKKQADVTNLLAKKYAGRNVVIYFVATDSLSSGSKNFASDEAVKKFAFDNKLTVPVLRDPDGALLLRKYKVEQVPSFLVLDKNGAAVDEAFGGIDPDPKYDPSLPIAKAIDKVM